jgi:hypothetical protein
MATGAQRRYHFDGSCAIMPLFLEYLLIATSALLLILELLAFAAIGIGRLSSRMGTLRDGFAPGTAVPKWSMRDVDGRHHQVPSHSRWQLLIFVDHSLKEFPGLVSALRHLEGVDEGVETLLLPRTDGSLTARVADALGLKAAVIPVSTDFYYRHRVRLMPFAMLVDPPGRVRSLGLVSRPDSVPTLWRKGRLAPFPEPEALTPDYEGMVPTP